MNEYLWDNSLNSNCYYVLPARKPSVSRQLLVSSQYMLASQMQLKMNQAHISLFVTY
jgi:hypothetical protein